MKILRVVNGYLKENAYIVYDEDSAYIIDPGQFADLIVKNLENLKISTIKGILLTHGHWDHVNCVDDLVEIFHCPVYMSSLDLMQIDGTLKGNLTFGKMLATLKTKPQDAFTLQDSNIIVYETPGHTKGSVCYFFKKENVLFSGDTLFYGSVGRTDLPGGSVRDLRKSIQLLFSLKKNIVVYPGHDEMTTIEIETKYNSIALKI